MSARDRILAAIRVALADVPEDESGPHPAGYLRSHAGDDIVGLFAERVADYRAQVFRTTPDRLPDVVAERLGARGVTRVVVPPGFPAGWLASARAMSHALLADAPRLSVGELDDADGVMTTAALGVAVTGTIVLDAGPGQGRRALSLLPDYHLCVIRTDQIVDDVPEALERLVPTRPLTFISGPSATSDIELDRVEGVHGPRALDVVIVDDDHHQEWP
jgi:L-lactate dehydrogenase complex protein LldG